MPTIEALEALLAKSPNDADLLYGLAMEHAKAGRTDVACGLFDRCLAADPAYCYAYFHKARTLQAAERDADAAACLRAGLDAATRAGDRQAISEISGYLDELDG